MDFNQQEAGDELLGFWENDLDDGSGLHAIWGYGIEFLPGGEGISHSWGSDVKKEDREQKIYWKRNGEKNISLKFLEDGDWDNIEYEMTFESAYAFYKLVIKGKEEFWLSPEPLYRRKNNG